ncbi:hypothetical protein QL093DRAFT_2167392 [Fusarium oxysporum]|nr:hypothetical protein QL093DRAFT_2167392 [Fusarium oxysporum]
MLEQTASQMPAPGRNAKQCCSTTSPSTSISPQLHLNSPSQHLFHLHPHKHTPSPQ